MTYKTGTKLRFNVTHPEFTGEIDGTITHVNSGRYQGPRGYTVHTWLGMICIGFDKAVEVMS